MCCMLGCAQMGNPVHVRSLYTQNQPEYGANRDANNGSHTSTSFLGLPLNIGESATDR